MALKLGEQQAALAPTSPSVLRFGVDRAPPPEKPEVLREKTFKLDLGMGEDSPGEDVLYRALENGDEPMLRAEAARKEDVKNRQKTLGIIRESVARKGGPLTPEEADEIRALSSSEVQADTDTIVEKLFAEKVISAVPSMSKSREAYQQKADEDPEGTLDDMNVAEESLTKIESAKNKTRELNAKWQQRSGLSKFGAFAEQFIPGYSIWWSSLPDAVKGLESDAFLLGNNLEEQVAYMWTLPPKEFNRTLEETAERIFEDNPLDAFAFLQAVTSYGPSDEALDNAFTVIDTFDLATIGVTATSKVARGLKWSHNVSRKLRSLPTAEEITVDGPVRTTDEGVDIHADFDPVTNTIRVNEKGILKQFQDKPWTTPAKEGVNPLPEDQFQTAEEYLDFVKEHERVHSVEPKPDDMTDAEYENMINQQALKNLEDKKPRSRKIRQALKDAVRGAGESKRADEAVAATGNVDLSARMKAYRRRLDEAAGRDPLEDGEGLRGNVASIYDVESLGAGATSLDHQQAHRILANLADTATELARGTSLRAQVNRLTPEATQQAVNEASELIDKRYPSMNHAVLDVRVVQPEETAVNVGTVVKTVGKPIEEAPEAVATTRVADEVPEEAPTPEPDSDLPRIESFGKLMEDEGEDAVRSYIAKENPQRLADMARREGIVVPKLSDDKAKNERAMKAFLTKNRLWDKFRKSKTFRDSTRERFLNPRESFAKKIIQGLKKKRRAEKKLDERKQQNVALTEQDIRTTHRQLEYPNDPDGLKQTLFTEGREPALELLDSVTIPLTDFAKRLKLPTSIQSRFMRDPQPGNLLDLLVAERAQQVVSQMVSKGKRSDPGLHDGAQFVIENEIPKGAAYREFTEGIRQRQRDIDTTDPNAPDDPQLARVTEFPSVTKILFEEGREGLRTRLRNYSPEEIADIVEEQKLFGKADEIAKMPKDKAVNALIEANIRRNTDRLAAQDATPEQARREVESRIADSQTREIENKVTEAYQALKKRPQDWVSLRELRQRLKGHSKSDVDKVLKQMFRDKRINLTLEEDQGSLTAADRAASMRLGVDDMHYISIETTGRRQELPFGKPKAQTTMGKPSATTFDSMEEAEYWATNQFGLEDYRIKQQGSGYTIEVSQDFNETAPTVRSLLTKGNWSSSHFINTFTRFLRKPDTIFSELQNQNRMISTTAPQEIHRLMLKAARPIEDLSKKDARDLETILEYNRDYINPDSGDRGFFYKNFGEVERGFQEILGYTPTPKQVEAYFSYVQLNDFDYVLRNMGIHRDVSRQGLEEFKVNFQVRDDDGNLQSVESDGFAAKEIGRIPWEDTEDAGIVVYDPQTRRPEYYRKNDAPTDVRDSIEKRISKDGYRVVQMGNPVENPFKFFTGDDTVNFMVVKDFKRQRYSWQHLPYRPGGHVEYSDLFFVKQPSLKRVDRGGGKQAVVYDGDTSILNASSQAEAKKLSENLETARKMLKGEQEGNLAEFLKKNLPWNEKQFRAFFEPRTTKDGKELPPYLSKDDPITWTYTGNNTFDMSHFAHVADNYSGFENNIRSKYNLFQQVDKKFVGKRDPDLPRVIEGTEQEPLHRLEKPRLVNPLATMNSSLANIIRSRFMTDYKISATEQFIEEFKDLMTVSPSELRSNPVYYLHNPPFKTATTDRARLATAKQYQQAVMQLIGNRSGVDLDVDWFQRKIVDEVYKTGGQKQANFVAAHLLPTTKDPATFMRSVAFHSKLGLFNPVQLFLQSQSFVHIMTVAGVKGAPGFATNGWLLRRLALTEDEGVLRHFANMSVNLGASRSVDDFMESYRVMKETGFYNVGGEQAIRDDMFSGKVMTTGVGRFFEKGTMFFKEGERFVRLAAWDAAFKEWRRANPTAVLDNRARNRILDRADFMSVNMTRKSNAAWQQGAFSVPTQFFAYQARLMDQILGGELTKEQMLRGFLLYSGLYGVPVAIGAGFGVAPWYEDIRQAFLERGIDPTDNKFMQAFHDGLVSTGVSAVTGNDYNFGERYGPGGLSIFKDILKGESNILEAMLGASGSIIGDIIRSVEPATRAVTGLFDDETLMPTGADLLEVTQNISSVNQAVRSYYLASANEYITKNEILLEDEINTMDVIAQGIFGLTPQEIPDTFVMIESMKEQKEAQDIMKKEAIKYYRRAVRLALEDDNEGFRANFRRAKAALKLGRFRPDQFGDIWREALKGHEPLFDRVEEQFKTNAPIDQFEQRKGL